MRPTTAALMQCRMGLAVASQFGPEGKGGRDQQETGEEDGHQGGCGIGNLAAGRGDHGAEISGKCEKRSRHRLGHAVARQKRIVSDNARGNDLRLQHRQDDMAAAEHQCANPVEDVGQLHQRLAGLCGQQRQPDEQGGEQGEQC